MICAAFLRTAILALVVASLGVVLGTCGGCAEQRPALVSTPSKPIFIAPSCEPENVLQRCQTDCLKEHGKRAVEAFEDAEHYWCVCKPFDT